MNKKLSSLALAAAMVGTTGVAHAVFESTTGEGQVLLYPYYTVEGGFDTYVSLTNTTSSVKAVKVRFLEAQNSQEVLDFNLYLSPNDVWSGVVTANESSGAAMLKTGDTSCTVGTIPEDGKDFVNFQYLDDVINGVERTREGYLEIIEMGVVQDSTLAAAATHTDDGVPADCGVISDAWNGGVWSANNNDGIGLPTGGLYGTGTLINVQGGIDAAYDAKALDNFVDPNDPLSSPLHTDPGSTNPSLNNATATANVVDGTTVYTSDFNTGVDAVTATLMRSEIANDFVTEPSLDAGTDWVVTFPTKRFYVNGTSAPMDPFTTTWASSASGEPEKACEEIGITYFDREEQQETPDDSDFSPQPPGEPPTSLCYEANVVTFNDSNVLAPSDRVKRNLDVVFDNGWLTMDLTNFGSGNVRTLESLGTTGPAETYRGLPVLGFSVVEFVNGDVGGLLSNYAGLFNHKGERNITQ